MEEYVTKNEFQETATRIEKAIDKLATGQEDILDTVNRFATHVEKRFSETASKKDLAALELKLIDAMDRKVGEVRGDLTAMMRTSNGKTVELVKTLKRRKTLTAPDATRILAMQPFPQT